jgi:cAMP phosphodiesterase
LSSEEGDAVKITLLPSAAGDASPEQLQHTTSILINDTVVIDAGSVGFFGSANDQARISHLFLSHSHIDHLGSLPIFVENSYQGGLQCVTVHGNGHVLDVLQRDMFNDRLWPDFILLSRGENRFLTLSQMEPGQTCELDGLRVTATPMTHVVPTQGYILSDAGATVAILSDTGPTEEVWRQLNALPRLDAVFVECCFPDALAWLAEVSLHLTPCMLARELAKLRRSTRVIAVHLKPRFRAEIIGELTQQLPGVEIGRFGVPYCF